MDSLPINRNPHVLILGLTFLMGLIDAVGLWTAPFVLDLHFLWRIIPLSLVLLLLSSFYHFHRPAPQLAISLLATLELLLFTLACGILSYLIMSIGWPWRDALFASWDRRLGFDWLAYTAFIQHRPWLYLVLGYLYDSSILQIACLTLILGFTLRLRELANFLGLIVLGGMATVVIGGMLPALGGYSYFNLPDHDLLDYVAATAAVHNHTLAVLDPRHLEGLVAFPSFHTTLSVGIIIASWSMRYLRYPVLIANLLLLAGVPVFGGHYLVDMLAGAGMAVIVTWLWQRLTKASAAQAHPPVVTLVKASSR
jgi:hypothetical protein